MLNRYLVEHASPTLAGLKTANLFTLPYTEGEKLQKQLSGWNAVLNRKGVAVTVLNQKIGTALVYVYRPKRLFADLSHPLAVKILAEHGYPEGDVDAALARLRERIAETKEFPHEIGLFLSYPPDDVEGFIVNRGKNCKCVGCWKVYCDECEAQKIFSRYKKCRDVYCKLWSEGRSIMKMTVAS